MIGQRKGLEGAKGVVIDFNSLFTRQIFAEIGDITAARFNKDGGNVYLEIMDPAIIAINFGRVDFTDGRHRLVAAYRLGERTAPVVVLKDQVTELQEILK